MELAGLGSLQEVLAYDEMQQICGSKRKASSVNDDVGTVVDQPNSSDEGADGNGSDDEARKMRRQLRNRLSAQQARDRKKAQMQQLQDQVLRQQQQMQQLQRQLADTEAANAALRNIICAIKGQPPGMAASPPQQQQDLPTSPNEPAVPPGVSRPVTLLSPASAPLGPNTLSSTAVIPPQVPQQQQLQLQDTPPHPQLQHAFSDSAAAIAAAVGAGVGSVDLLRRSCSNVAASAAAVGASPTAVAAMHFAHANPFRRKSSSTVAALAGLLPIAQRMASDTGPADTTLQVLQQMQQQQWQTSADQSVLAAAASAASAAEAAAAAASHGASGNRSSTSISGWEALLRTNGGGVGSASSNREDAQIKRRQLLLLLAQRDSTKKAGDRNGKPRPSGSAGVQQQQQSGGMSLPQGYHQFRIPDQYTATTAALANDVKVPLATQLNSIPHTSNQDVVGTSAAQVMGTATTAPGQPGGQQSAPQQLLLSDLLETTPAAAETPWGQAPAPVVSAGQSQQQQQLNGIRFSDLTGPSSGSGCGSASLGFGRAPSDGLFRLNSADVMLTDLLTDMA